MNKSVRRMSKTTSTIDVNKDANNAKYYSTRCEICFEPFHIGKRRPKLLPCEHNFCEQCILSLCCHQQYYLLDSINCPTCRTEFSTSTALSAATNYNLCQLLETVQRQQMGISNDSNVTVIHVPDNNCIAKGRLTRFHSWRRNSTPPSAPKRCQLMQCTDCSRKMNEKRCRKEARFCVGCFSTKKDDDDCLRVICLECCVNRHNGHKLITLSELECEHQKLIEDLHTLQQSIQKTNKWIEASLKVLSEDSMLPATDFVALRKAKQNLRNECEADMRFALSVLESGGTTPLPPTALQRMRQHQYHNSARLHKLLHFIEKCNQSSIKESYNRSIKVDTSISHSSLLSLNRQTRITFCNSACDDRSAAEAIAAVLTVCESRDGSGNRMAVVEEAMKVMSRKGSKKAVRRAALLCCAKQLRESIDENISRQSILLYIDAYLHIFYQLNLLVTRFPSTEDGDDATIVTRWDIWKLIQVVYSDLMRCAAKHWKSEESERIDLVDDLAFLCSLYSDVSDEATITICMIEAARARAAAAAALSTTADDRCQKLNGSEDDGRLTMNIRLNLIDEHLLECRRVQKLQCLRATTVTRPRKCVRQQSLKQLWKLFSACFNNFSQHR
uniref:RING-type domain-containing protein n=1 Tax=Elaeophora elaphi TaxID=1147741 RepID=A0A158Q6T5_9BILA